MGAPRSTGGNDEAIMASRVTYYTVSRWSGRSLRAIPCTMQLCCAAQLAAVGQPRRHLERTTVEEVHREAADFEYLGGLRRAGREAQRCMGRLLVHGVPP